MQPPVPIYDGDGLRPTGDAFGPECKGQWVMTASSKQRQEIVDTNLNPIINSLDIYSGMYARVSLNFFAYSNAGKKGIGCGLGPVQKTRDGEPLGGRVTAADAFGGYQAQPAYAPPAGAYAPAAGTLPAAARLRAATGIWSAAEDKPDHRAADVIKAGGAFVPPPFFALTHWGKTGKGRGCETSQYRYRDVFKCGP